MTAADKFIWSRYDTLLRRDFVSFAQRCFRELNPRTQFAMNCRIEIIAAGATERATRRRAEGATLDELARS
jgi:hypothetical protein